MCVVAQRDLVSYEDIFFNYSYDDDKKSRLPKLNKKEGSSKLLWVERESHPKKE